MKGVDLFDWALAMDCGHAVTAAIHCILTTNVFSIPGEDYQILNGIQARITISTFSWYVMFDMT